MARGAGPRRGIRLSDLDPAARTVLARLTEHGHEAALVGGCVRDLLHGTRPVDWDVATDATPEVVTGLFPGATWENPFGTVTVRAGPRHTAVEVTTYRVESGYRDHRRPERIRWGGSLTDDLARRDFTINAVAWLPPDDGDAEGTLVDPHGGLADLKEGVLRAVGDPDRRLAEDALRILRAVRFALRFGLRIEPGTEAAIRRNASLAAGLSGERVREELLRMLATPDRTGDGGPPSGALRLLEDLGILPVILPELAALQGVPQAKAVPGDAFDHSLRTMDALPGEDPLLRLIGALHDVGKATTLADGHFIGHETLGARMVEAILRRLRCSKADVARGEHLVRMHMFDYRTNWTDAAVRRFIRRVGARALPDLFALRHADDVASGAEARGQVLLDELRARVGAELASHPLTPRQLAVHGDDLTRSLGIAPGPVVGRLLHRLMEAVLDDPLLNERTTLLGLARTWVEDASVVRSGTAQARLPRKRTASPGPDG